MTTYIVNTWFTEAWKKQAERLNYFETREEAWAYLMEVAKENPAKVEIEEIN